MNMHVKADGKFKVGQRVRLAESVGLASVGATATVARFEGKWMRVNWDRNGLDGDQMDGGYYPHSFEPAPLFAVGDKVRAVRTSYSNAYIAGNTYVVKSAGDNHISTERDEHGSRTNGWGADNFEPAYTSCAAAEVDNLADEYGGGRKFKIGDRVNWTRVRGKFDGSTIDAIDSSGTWPVTIRATSGEHTYAALSELEHVAVAPATTTLTIRAGACYKTRDGRKVGPMEHRRAGFAWRNHGEVRYVDAEGKHIYGLRNCDLIAEWPAVAAQQPTTMADIVRKHSGTAIVCLIENGQPKPSTLPFVHLNKDAAATEAARLAGIHKGQEFGVYACVDVRKVERVYEHEWQRLADGGQKINAIRELRGMTGLGLATTKGAVEDWLEREAA